MAKTKLRLAPLIRVAMEKEKSKGESLQVQKSRIEEYVKSQGGIIPENCWGYSGQ